MKGKDDMTFVSTSEDADAVNPSLYSSSRSLSHSLSLSPVQFVADNAATSHVIKDRWMFDPGTIRKVSDRVTAVVGERVAVEERGSVTLYTPNGKKITLLNALYIPNGNLNLFSIGRAEEAGATARQGDMRISISGGALGDIVLESGRPVGEVYFLSFFSPGQRGQKGQATRW